MSLQTEIPIQKSSFRFGPIQAVSIEDQVIDMKSLLDYGYLESVLISPQDRFAGLSPPINEAINLIQAEMMSYVTLKIVTCPRNFTSQNYPTHVIKLLVEVDREDYPDILYSDGYDD